MPNNCIPQEIKEQIEKLSKKDYAINRIAKLTGTCRPTVRKYQALMKKDD